MAGTEFTLDLLGPIILETRDRLRNVEQRLTAIEEDHLPDISKQLTEMKREVSAHSDEMTALSATVMRYSAEPIAWGAMRNEIRKLRERIEALESKR